MSSNHSFATLRRATLLGAIALTLGACWGLAEMARIRQSADEIALEHHHDGYLTGEHAEHHPEDGQK